MGNSCSPIIAGSVLMDLEGDDMKEFDYDVVFYGRYVSDAYIITPSHKINFVFTSSNNYHC